MSTLSEMLTPDQPIPLGEGDQKKTYVLSDMHVNAMANIEGHFNVNLTAPAVGGNGKNGLQVFFTECLTNSAAWRYVIWQLLLKYHRTITEDEVGYLVTMRNMPEVYDAVMRQIIVSLPIPDDQKKIVLEQTRGMATGIGSSSSPPSSEPTTGPSSTSDGN